jgi:hypothetical protein
MADQFNVCFACKRLAETVVWMQRGGVLLQRQLLFRPKHLETYHKCRKRHFLGLDRIKRPIYIERFGEFVSMLHSQEARSLTMEDWIACYLYEMQEFVSHFRNAALRGEYDWKVFYIIDCANIKFFNAMFVLPKLIMRLSKEVERHFPETVGASMIINVSNSVLSAWKVVKNMIDPSTVEKLTLHVGIPSDVLLQNIDREVLPTEYGGDRNISIPHLY